MMETKSVLCTPDCEYEEQRLKRQEVRACLGGKMDVLKIVTCLPAPQYQTYNLSGLTGYALEQARACNQVNDQRKKAYWARGRFFNATARTYESLGGMVWSKEPEENLSNSLSYLTDNADGSNSGLREVTQEITDNLIAYGRYGVLVDMAPNTKGLTRAQMKEPSKAPRLIQYDANQIIYYRLDGNSLAEVRLLEVVSVQKNEFEWEDKTQVRRLVMLDGVYVNQLYNDKDEFINEVTPIANGSTLGFIPFQFFGADANTARYSKVPLYDLANTNLGHFVLDCDNRDNLHYHGQGMTNVYTDMDGGEFADVNPNGISVSGSGRNLFRRGDKVEILQIDATGALPAEQARDEQRMVMQGAQLVTDNSTNQTLGAKEIETNASTSALKRIVRNTNAGIKNCLKWCSMFLGVTEESTYIVNTDFIADTMSPEMIAKHIELVQLGVLPKATLNETARNVGFTTLEDDEIQDQAEQDAAEMIGMTQEAAQAQINNEAE